MKIWTASAGTFVTSSSEFNDRAKDSFISGLVLFTICTERLFKISPGLKISFPFWESWKVKSENEAVPFDKEYLREKIYARKS